MLTTLDHLEKYTHKKQGVLGPLTREIAMFVGLFVCTFLAFYMFTNMTLIKERILLLFVSTQHSVLLEQSQQVQPRMLVQNTLAIEQEKISQLVDGYIPVLDTESTSHNGLNNKLKGNLNAYSLGFNTLSPTNRLHIPKLGQNVPIVSVGFTKPIEEVKEGEFDDELYKGVVQYPTTATPGTKGNTLFFGHTSYDSRKQNKYGTVFAGLPQLQEGDMVQVVRDGKLITYVVERKVVVKPSQVNATYLQYNSPDAHYITLMGCYPLGTTKERLLIIAREVVDPIQK